MTDFTYENPPNQQGEDGIAMGEYINRQMLKISNAVEQIGEEGGNVRGPSSSVVDNVASFANTTGDEIKDSGIASANVVKNTGGTVTDGHLAVFDGTDGRKIKDGGAPSSGGGGEPRNYLRNTDFAIFQKGELIEQITDNTTPVDGYEWVETNMTAGFRVRFTVHDRLSSPTYRPVPGTQRFLNVFIQVGDIGFTNTARVFITQHIELQDIIPLLFGSPDAQDIFLSFWFRSRFRTGDHVVSLQNRDRNRTFVHKFNVPTAFVWQKVEVPIAGDTGGVWESPTYNYEQGLSVIWALCVGGNYQTSDLDQWNNDDRFGATGMAQIYQAGEGFDISSPYLHVGSSAAQYASRNRAEDWDLNARYYQTSRTRNQSFLSGGGPINDPTGQRYKFASDNGDIRDHVMFENCMRDTPTITTINPNTGAAGIRYNGSTVTPTILNTNQHSFALEYTGTTQNATVEYHWDADATMKSFW